jgi:hypothetical protein
MARPGIGIFGALFAVGSVLAWRWAQAQRDNARRGARDLHRWEDEGGKVITPASAVEPAKPASKSVNGTLGGTRDAWNFPRS